MVRSSMDRGCALFALSLGVLVACDRGGAESSAGSGAAASVVATGSPAPSAPAAPLASAVVSPPGADARSESLQIVFGGDVNLGRGAGQKILADPSYDPFREIAPLWKDADLRFVNLECQLSDQNGETQSPNNRLVFTGPPGGARTLRRAGIGVVSLANNHMWDYGGKAYLETLRHLDEAGVPFTGASRKPGMGAYEPTIVRVKGWSIAFFAVTHIWNHGSFEEHRASQYVAWARFDRLSRHLRKAREEHDLVFVSYHGGSEYLDVPMEWTREFVRAVMKTGVDAILGHHPHVPQGIGWVGDRPIFYSLGNFVFAMHRDHPWTGIGLLAKLDVARDGGMRVSACPFHILGHVPMPLSTKGKGRQAVEAMTKKHLQRISVAAGRSVVADPGPDGCFAVTPPEGRFATPSSKANLEARARLRRPAAE